MRSPELKLEAITTVYGDTDLRAKIAKKLTYLEGCSVPVAAGEKEPISPHTTIHETGHEGQGFLTAEDLCQKVEKAGIEKDAINLMIHKIKENPGEVNIVAIGPLTNIAKALEKEPTIDKQIKRIYIMGGAFKFPEKATEENLFENYEAIEEYNIMCDITAARKVFESGIPITLVPLDITTKVKWSRNDLGRLVKKQDELSQGLARMTEIWFAYKSNMHDTPMQKTSMHDPLTLAVLFDSSLVKKKNAHIIITEDGKTIAENKPGNVDICYEVDIERFEKMLKERILNLNLEIKLKELIEISKWSDREIEWNANCRITTMDIWQRKENEERANAVKNYVRKNFGKTPGPQEFIDALANEKEYNPLSAGAIVNALMYDSENSIPNVSLDMTKLQKPLDVIGLGAKGGRLHIKGNLGSYGLEKAVNTKVIIEGNVGLRFADRSARVNAYISDSVNGELCGKQSSYLSVIIKGDLRGNYAFAESEAAQAYIGGKIQNGNVGTSAGMGSQGLKVTLAQEPKKEYFAAAEGTEVKVRRKQAQKQFA
jgi:purine nucleosidase